MTNPVSEHSRPPAQAGSRLGQLRRGFALKLEQIGPVATLKLGTKKLWQSVRRRFSSGAPELHPFDLEHGTETSSIVELGALDLPHDRLKHAVRYQTAIVEVFVGLLHDLSINYEDFTFIDLGSGKGRALLLASNLPFRQIIGVEISPNLHEIACRNIAIYKDPQQRCHQINSVCVDATQFQVPKENTVFYMFNPFDEVVMRPSWENIRRSLKEHPRQIYIVYLKPLCRHIFDEASVLEVFKETDRYVIYRSRSAG